MRDNAWGVVVVVDLARRVAVQPAETDHALSSYNHDSEGTLEDFCVDSPGVIEPIDEECTLRVGSETVDELTLAQTAPSRTYNATLLQPLGATGTANSVSGPGDRIVEPDKTDNAYTVKTETEERDVPAPGVVSLLALALAALLRRRGSPAEVAVR